MAAKRDRKSASRNQRSKIRRRTTFVVLTVLPVIFGLTWFNLSSNNVDQIHGYTAQALLLKDVEANREALRYQLNAASDGYISNGGQVMQSAISALNPGFPAEIKKIKTTLSPGIKELEASTLAYTAVAEKAVTAALAGGNTASQVKAIMNSSQYKETDEEMSNSIAAAHLGSSLASNRGDDNWKILVVAELALTLAITILVGLMALTTERAIGRADVSERARKQDRNNLDTEPFTQIIATMSDGVLVVAKDNTIVTANPAALAMLGMQTRIGTTFEIPSDATIEIRKSDGETGKGTVSASSANVEGKDATIVTIREEGDTRGQGQYI
jgi:PAS domain-containing protein